MPGSSQGDSTGNTEITEEKAKNGTNGSKSRQEPQDFEFPYNLSTTWAVWYDRPSSKPKATNRAEYVSSMKHIYEFGTVKSFWGLYNHLNLGKMPVGANLRIFKNNIQPTWEDPKNREGGNWILVPRIQQGSRESVATVLYKELLLAMIGGDLDQLVNGIVLSIKTKDTIIQLWCESNKSKHYNRVQAVASEVLNHYCKHLLEEPDSLQWTWRPHPTAQIEEKKDRKRKGNKDVQEDDTLNDMALPTDNRGSCGECLRTWHTCSVQ